MQEFQERKRIRKIIYSRNMLIFLTIILAFLIFSVVKVYVKSRAAILKNDEAKKELADLEKRKSELGNEIARLETEFGAEEELREKFNVGKPGENILVIVDKEQENAKIEQNSGVSVFLSGFWQKIKNIFSRN